MRNLHIGQFRIEGLRPIAEPQCGALPDALDLDGILHVTAIEKATGLSKHITISGATRRRSSSEIISSKAELERLFAGRVGELSADMQELPLQPGSPAASAGASTTVSVAAPRQHQPNQ